MDDRHVVLVGLPGAGKTSIARRLAKVLGRPFADADEQLELTTGITIPRLFRERGEAELRRLEARTLLDLVSRSSPIVVSAPGGARVDASLAGSGTVVWIRGSVRFLAELSDPTYRPRLRDDHEAALRRLDCEVSPLYAAIADHVVDVEPFHSLDIEPHLAIAAHTAELLGARVVGESEAIEPAVNYAEIADHIVDVGPFRSIEGDPKRAIVRRIIELLDQGRGEVGPARGSSPFG